MIPKEVIQLRKEVEDKKYKLSSREIYEYTQQHLDTMRRKSIPINLRVPIYHENHFGKNLVATNATALVIGAHGPYVEFQEDQFTAELIIPPDQMWRTYPKYRNNVKYLHKCPIDNQSLKIYHQLKTVSYADYKPGMYYIDYYLLRN